jgi:tetratricopeptide (TPR) repeat protein
MPTSTESRCLPIAGAFLLCTIAATEGVQPPVTRNHPASLTWRARGVDLAYNLDYTQAAAAFERAAALDPEDPAVHRLVAAATWMKLLFERGAILVDDYLGQANRERRYDEAQRAAAHLRERYPRNRLLWLETGSTALRAGRPAEARQALEIGLRMLAADTRPRAFGEEARWKLTYAKALVLLRDLPTAERELLAAVSLTAPGWVHGRAHLEIGKVDDLRGDRKGATDAYRRAASLCDAGNDEDCAGEARKLVRSAYHG